MRKIYFRWLILLMIQKVSDTPLEVDVKICRDEDTPLPNPTLHHHIVCSLIYRTMT